MGGMEYEGVCKKKMCCWRNVSQEADDKGEVHEMVTDPGKRKEIKDRTECETASYPDK